MAVDIHPAESDSMPHLVAGIVSDAQQLVKQEIGLFKQEIRDELKRKRNGALKMTVAYAFVIIGLLLLMLMLAHGLHAAITSLTLWGAYGISGVVACLVAAGLFYWGFLDLSSIPLIDEPPPSTKETEQWNLNRK